MFSRTQVVAGVVLASVLAGSGTASAQEVGGRQEGRGFGPFAGAVFWALDTDHDGALSRAEIDAAPAVLKALDRDHDGRLLQEELPRPMPRPGGEGFPGRGGREGRGGEAPEARPTSPDDLVSALMAFDADKDGKLTRAEVPGRFQGLFDRADTNKDGVLTEDELRRAAAAQPQPAESTEGGRGEGEGRGRGDGEGRGREAGRGGPPMGMRDPLFAALDADGDGVLSGAEIDAAAVSLRRLDRNGDGILTLDELMPPGRGRGGL